MKRLVLYNLPIKSDWNNVFAQKRIRNWEFVLWYYRAIKQADTNTQHNSLIKRVIEEHYMVDHEVSTPCREGYWEILLRNRLHYIYFHTFICKPLPGPYGIKVVTKFLTPRLRLYACVWTAQKQSANTYANCWRQITLASILANSFSPTFSSW